ncbi:TIGR00266 family protein [Methylobacter sp. Wu1]|uniref:TIGR00266 family protein n=1 Tax=Methylobacter sp. Wu1 TaxID=3119359 RepID=UPI0032AF80FE
MNEWFFSFNNTVSGPYSLDYAKVFAREHQGAYCWCPRFPDWIPIFEAAEIRPMKKDGVTPFPPPPAHMMSPKPAALPVGAQPVSAANTQPDAQSSGGFGQQAVTDGIDYKIYGHEMQFVEIELDPQESAVAEAGAMMYKSAGVKMETIFGDGSANQQSGIMGLLLGAGKRLLTNESLFVTVFTQNAHDKGKVAFAAPFPGTILALNLNDYGQKLICQKDSFLAAAKGVQIGIHFQRRILTGLFGGEGFVMQKLEGNGWVFVHAGGCLHKIELAAGEMLHVDTGCLAAMTGSVDFDIQQAGGIKTMLFGGEGLFFAKLTGPGTVWLQSLPFSRLAGRMMSSAPQGGGRQQGEGSILGGLGNLLDGD